MKEVKPVKKLTFLLEVEIYDGLISIGRIISLIKMINDIWRDDFKLILKIK